MKIKEEKRMLVMDVTPNPLYSVRSYTEGEIGRFLKLDKQETRLLKKKGLS